MVELIINTADVNQDGLIPDFLSSGTGSIQQFFNQDNTVSAFIRPVVPNEENSTFPWAEDYDADDVLYLQIGDTDARATSGTFKISASIYISNDVAWNATAAEVQAQVDEVIALAGVTQTVTVTKLTEGVFQIDWDDVGIADLVFQGDDNQLNPDCEIKVTRTRIGDASTVREQQVMEIRQTAVASSTFNAVYSPVSVTATQKVASSGTQNAIYEINLGDAYAGEYTVSIVANGVTNIVVLSAEMESDAIGIALAAHPEIYYQDVTEPDNVAISKSGSLITIQFIGTLGGTSSVLAITDNTIANPTVVTSAGHKLKTGDSIVVSGSNSTPTINGTQTVTVLTEDTFTVPVNVTVAGTAGSFYATTQPAVAYGSNLSLLTPKGFTGTINLNTTALAKAFWSTTEDALTYPCQIKRVRDTGEERTIFGAMVTLKRQLISIATLTPVPSLITYQSGTQTCSTTDTVAVTFASAMPSASYHLTECFVEYTGGGAAPLKLAICSVEDLATTGFTVALNGNATADYRINYTATAY